MRFLPVLILPAAFVLALFSADTPAPPAIEPDGVWNAASMMPPSLPGGAVARGARILISGVRLGPASAVEGSEAAPEPSLAGVDVDLVRGESATPLPLLSVSARRIEAWIPPSVPAGPAKLIVKYQDRASEPYDLRVATEGFGFFTATTAPRGLPEAGRRQGGASGDMVTLWGTGRGASDLELFVGGRPADVTKAEEACCAGVSGVQFQIPPDAPSGCFVPVAGRSRASGLPTNFTAISVHTRGQACRDQVDWFRQTVEGSQTAGFVVLARVALLLGGSDEYRFDYGLESFGRQQSGKRPFPPFPPPNTCTAFTDRISLREALAQSRTPSMWPGVVKPAPGNRALDAGSISFRGPQGVRVLPGPGVLGGRVPFSHHPSTPLFAVPGRYTIEAAGGGGIGAFSVSIPVAAPLLWRNRAQLAAVDRKAGATLQWKASRKADAILIVAAGADRVTGDSAMSVCMAPAAAGRFAIPPLALANIPPTDPAKNPDLSYLLLLEVPAEPPAPIHAAGLDSGFAAFVSASVRDVRYR